MKLKTSSFRTVFRKDLFRFAPLWALYFIGGLMVTLAGVELDNANYYQVENLNDFLVAMGIINMIYAALCAQVLFGDLFTGRMCNALHALPLRRETWFLSHVAAGLCYSLVPHLVVMLLVALSMGEFWFVPLLWIAVSALGFVFFFGVAVLSCMCTGNRIAMVLVYAIINFISGLAYGFIQLVYMPQLPGLELEGDIFYKLCPVVTLTSGREYFGFETNKSLWDMTASQRMQAFQIHWSAWVYPAVLAVLGLAALGLALLLYRRRALECAGDFVAIRVLNPVFTVIYTLCVGAVFALLGEAFVDSYVAWLLVGLAVGYFTSRMLLQRTVRVFQPKSFLYCAIFMAALGLSVWVTDLDPLGLTRWTPEIDSVSSVTVSNSSGSSILELTEPEEIEKAIAAHKQAIANGRTSGSGSYWYYDSSTSYVSISYQLKDGSTRKRSYYLTAGDLEPLRTEYSAPERVLGYEDWEQFASGVKYIEICETATGCTVELTDREEIQELLEAIKQDCEAGIMAQLWVFRSQPYEQQMNEYGESYGEYDWDYDLYLQTNTSYYNGTYNSITRSISIYQQGQATAWIQEHVTFGSVTEEDTLVG